ncbi:MAG: tRNA (N6-threonylcarbamoyladenosine(37)-N6)-methyltransferase TrmO [Methanobacteriaceae archaeon]|nr:tRNA (N6-threonylcarbamoyladenosine(37)-N6)-methyltransferase TrmO [Methanobacteriaceae archaeon]
MNEFDEVIYHPIGVINSNYTIKEETPKSSKTNDDEAELIVNPVYLEAMSDIKVGKKYFIIFHFHKSEGFKQTVPIYGDGPMTGLFSTHAPSRPNSIGLSTITVKEVIGNIIKFTGVDMLDGTPVLDIKNYTQ